MKEIFSLITKHQIKNINTNSQKIAKGDLFIALKGEKFDGNNFIEDALDKGASLIFSEIISDEKKNIVLIKDLKRKLANILQEFYFKNEKVSAKLIAVTGTNGKSSVVNLVSQLLTLFKQKTATIGTLGVFIDNNKILKSNLTSPDICSFYQILSFLQQEKCQFILFEASSHSLEQKRFENIMVDLAVWTNLTQDHLDYHQTMKNYFASKKKLFAENILQKNGSAIINIDDDYGKKLFLSLKNIKNKISYGADAKADARLIDNQFFFKKNKYILQNNNLVGAFQKKNLLASFLILNQLSFSNTEIIKKISKLKSISGRFEKIKENIFIDFAHTPDALKNLLSSVQKDSFQGKIILVFGCGGDRDQKKRPLMAKIAKKYADFIIVTDDNPREENATKIRKDIIDNLTNNFVEIADRKKAIIYALNKKEKNDIVLIAGKGHEEYQIIGKEKYPFSDKNIVLSFFEQGL